MPKESLDLPFLNPEEVHLKVCLTWPRYLSWMNKMTLSSGHVLSWLGFELWWTVYFPLCSAWQNTCYSRATGAYGLNKCVQVGSLGSLRVIV